jgi:hypothetical protein
VDARPGKQLYAEVGLAIGMAACATLGAVVFHCALVTVQSHGDLRQPKSTPPSMDSSSASRSPNKKVIVHG